MIGRVPTLVARSLPLPLVTISEYERNS